MQRPDYDLHDERMKELERLSRSANRLIWIARIIIIISAGYWLFQIGRSWLG